MVEPSNRPIDLSAWEEAVAQIAEIRETLTRLQEDRPDDATLEDFAGSVLETLESMAEWIQRNSRVTPKQVDAIQNISAGVARWER